MVEVNSRVGAAWSKWRSLTGVLCDRKIPEHLKSKIYRAVVRPVAMYGAECWPATKEVETRLSVMETKMLRWTAGIKRMDRIRNDAIRQKFGVAPIADKMREARLRWYGHVLGGKEDTVRKIGLELEVSGKRPRGRPKQRWSDTSALRQKILGRLKPKIYRAVVRPVAIYGAECWPVTKEIERRLSVMETKMLRWTAGVTRLDRVLNESIWQKFGVTPLYEKMREARLRWYSHVLRSKDDTV
ncbi:unnamed protein product [Heligmosomoides polygyrus]|uniref:Reverse transcriptase n=1 Tax=Heligmosomoides polygyrus TaxID=6339 RepID=A0A3P7ZK09_HELPZ|nr:unnamed protein product [Heligmosomoides polygyrus]